MKIIEFFGLPYSGKTFFSSYYKKLSKTKTYDIKSLILFYILKKNGFNLYVLLSLLKKKFIHSKISSAKSIKVKSIKKKNFFYKISKKILYSSYLKFKKKKNKLYKESKVEYAAFYEIILKILASQENKYRKKNLRRWIKDEMISVFIAKKKDIDGILIMSEGFIQRFQSYFLYKKDVDLDLLEKYLKLCPKSDIIFFVNTDLKIIKKRLKNYNHLEKERFYLENLDNLQLKINKIMQETKKIQGFQILTNKKDLINH